MNRTPLHTRRDILTITASSVILPACTRLTQAAEQEPEQADPTRVLPAGESPADYRLGKAKTLKDDFSFTPPKTLEAWKIRRKQLREQVLVANGLWPMPEKVPLNAVVHRKIERDDYTIEKVYFVSVPGHYVTGNLYRPKAELKSGEKRPGVLNPHGHWPKGRFYENTETGIAQQIKSKAEKTVEGAKSPLQARCVTLARMGCVAFHYDMVGYADSKAIPHILKSGVPHPEGFHDAEGELRLQSVMGLQTLNSIRALDFLESLPDVDPQRLAVTGSSGGGTQTFLLAAIDDRVKAAFPAVMVSTAMQGGCVCENCSLLRVGTGNIELAGLFAPKPLAMSAAQDWTHELMTKGYPELKQLYKLYGSEENVLARAWLEHGHNYNLPAREMMYHWFNKHLFGKDEPVAEKPFTFTPPAELSVFDDKHPMPKDFLPAKEFRAKFSEASDTQIKQLAGTPGWPELLRTALRSMIVDELPREVVIRKESSSGKLSEASLHKLILGRTDERDALPIIRTSTVASNRKVLIWIHPDGKSSLNIGESTLKLLEKLWKAGFDVIAPDLLGTGELIPKKPFEVSEVYSGFTYGYNRSLFANRVHDILTVIAYAQKTLKAAQINLVGWGKFGPIAVVAKAIAGKQIHKLAADVNGFLFANLTKTDDPMLLPGALKYGDLGRFIQLAGESGSMLIHNQGRVEYGLSNEKIKSHKHKLDEAEVINWLA